MNNRTEAKLTDLSGIQKGIEGILQQAWERGRKYGQNEERPQGEWEHIPDDTNKQRIVYKCSVCGRIIDVYYREDLAYAYPFCHCGADMRKAVRNDT